MQKLLNSSNRQNGAALFMALVILLAITMLSMASLQTSILELRMSGNTESTARSMHMSQAAIDVVLNDVSTNFAIVGGLGYKNCTSNVSITPACNEFNVTLPSPQFDNDSKITIERLSNAACVSGSSCTMFKGVTYSIYSEFDKVNEGLGRVHLLQGLVRIIPTYGQSNQNPPTGSMSN